ncbi:S1/P1 Nuclease [Brumimicrobium salinarum]|uniref:S1/P1 Nuclease n=1 Tax=Brumimicrobium salinarum TaxID=2058658 RepID=A0A2I0R4L2_9FLAO|nr:S1/P1 nuclease [Brumimicrobium salinarum]PKR81330.1 S1/P1 Nuclease [Brumimicrobium salinarum]
MLGHRVVGEVASKHLNEGAKEKLKSILGNKTLAEVSNWMDDIKSDSKYDSLKPWHYVTIPDGLTYQQTNKNPKGDAISGINFVVAHLKKDNLDPQLEQEYLNILVHLVGDLHQPLHVGNGNDRGGNDVKMKWFGKSSNLHRIWDSEIIDGKLYSYTELTKIINHPTSEQVEEIQAGTVEDWAHESMTFREGIYAYDTGYAWEYKYQYAHWETLKNQLLKGGIRLAGILNEIYD